MDKAKKGDTVKVHYTGKLKNGEIFDSSVNREPLEFTVGAGMMIKGFDDAVNGMTTGEKIVAEIPAEKAYGTRREELIINIPKNNIPSEISPEVGLKLMMNNDGRQIPVTVTKVSENEIELDANHELAGKDLIFEIELVSIG